MKDEAPHLAASAGEDAVVLGAGSEREGLVQRILNFREIGMVVAVLLTGLFFTTINSQFAEPANLANIASQISFEAVLAVSMTFVIITGEIDLSIGSMVGLCGIVFGLLLEANFNIWVAALLTMAVGTAMGMLNGYLCILLRVPSIIITLGMLNAYRGAAYFLSDGYPIEKFDKTSVFFNIGQDMFGGIIPYNAVVLVIFAVISSIVLSRTVFGHRLYAMGSNLRAARLAGIDTNRLKVTVLAFNGLAAAIAALLTVSQTSTADPNVGIGYELDAIAASIIGGASLAGGAGSVLGAVLGMLVLGMIRNGLVIIGVSIYLLVVVSGLAVIAAVAINLLIERQRRGARNE
jgi:ribose/xylose/arabinose/galactoside ABC-type transport system permease subunit